MTVLNQSRGFIKGLMYSSLALAFIVQAGCGSKEAEESDSGSAVGGTMVISVPSSFQMAIVTFKSAAGEELARVEPVDEKNYDVSRQDGSVVRLIVEKKQLVANGPDGQPLYSIVREGDWVRLTPEGASEPTWRLKYNGSDIEVYQEGDAPQAVLRWVADELNFADDKVHLVDPDDTLLGVTAIEDGVTVLRNPEGESQVEAHGMTDRLPMGCLGITGMSLEQQVGHAVFVASQ